MFNSTVLSAWPTWSSHPYDMVRQPIQYPFYHIAKDSLVPGLPDNVLAVLGPFLIYWAVSGIFALIDHVQMPFFEQYRIHEPEEVKSRNRVTPGQVFRMVLLQQAVQTVLGLWWLDESDPAEQTFRDHAADMNGYARVIVRAAFVLLGPKTATRFLTTYGAELTSWAYWWGVPMLQFFCAAVVMDAWQYMLHRSFHQNKFLYKHVHSVHHRLYVPYAYGALYNHPLEGFLLDTIGAVLSESAARMSTRQAVLFFCISTAKTVDDHCGLKLPFDPLQRLFNNNSDYHDIHHQFFGISSNFAQPFFISWDVICGTRLTREAAAARRKPRTDLRDPLIKAGLETNGHGNLTEQASKEQAQLKQAKEE
ncbi:uncharacterized protein L969DRAFT_45933 [Mixia osmundae IAM 14324]|uniref:Fatty acid hydroxylase domain-containing protein n=1 Tax=Mixia osmundae (strain CBS 9802 / IAM 14324 / JCM 22182 / KY 12970) TaxID=764103 RepID=G7EAQ0_MIXOS|nr:uncharacterized protein L969DRAFT_45933 [Mixia osmundae IAM 14324]KEI40879.1 hypothetical protein L969DRAFT_45933 [Mixia osmundae IAM 14324]GAA99910.1 hypothetical protein E5Q_06613 [Mixia osmundae IAM 14324]